LKDVQRQATELDTVITSIIDGVVIEDTAQNILRINPAAVRILGYTPEEQALPVTERVIKVLQVTADDGSLITDPKDLPVSRALRGETVQNLLYEVLNTRADRKVWVLGNSNPLCTSDGTIFGVVTTLTDITNQKEMELKLQQANEQLDHRVKERTIELKNLTEALQLANEELVIADEKLRTQNEDLKITLETEKPYAIN
jgi:two-component system, sensor histidine kinase and response regulator